ncbi:glycosyltransferase family 2 protein [Prochlorococcus sp. MIT 1341]|uniref:glycosyltransferase family 2 protein n=1 Tax=Prochlorococcus sp. MIT 1341 TaxID=3096221 RepID=UPI002A75C12C|nr:glycosyltransferase family 2 protein [Prochlorococcus sp. MIT 1341]
MSQADSVEISFVIPCLNEARTLKSVLLTCHNAGKYSLSYEIIVADNGSDDGSIEIAQENNAKVIHVKTKGYGAAVKAGVTNSKGKYVVVGDADSTYDFNDSIRMIESLRTNKYNLVMGNRFGRIEKNAMPFLHRYLGNPVLTAIGNVLFEANVNDFYCGLRAFKREDILKLNLKSDGMEYCFEMIIRSCLAGYSIFEVPAKLRRDHPDRSPHLRTWRDGWRTVKFMFSFSPKYSYFPLSLVFCFSSLILLVVNLLESDPFSGSNTLSLSVVLYACGLWTSSEYISSRLLLATKIQHRHSFFSELLFKFVRSRSFLDKAFQLISVLLLLSVSIVGILFYNSDSKFVYLTQRVPQLSFYVSMILATTALYLYLVATKISTFSWINE